MRYMIAMFETDADFARREDPAYWGAWGAYVAAINAAGIMVSGAGLLPPATGTSLRIRNGESQVQDGPYADTKEHLGGIFVIDVPDLDTAMAWAAKSPSALSSYVEVRPVLPPMNG